MSRKNVLMAALCVLCLSWSVFGLGVAMADDNEKPAAPTEQTNANTALTSEGAPPSSGGQMELGLMIAFAAALVMIGLLVVREYLDARGP